MSDSTPPNERLTTLIAAEQARHIPNITGETVAVLVGSKVFHVHEAVITSSSEFFKNAMKPEWRTDLTKPINLSNERPDTFEQYSRWLYTRRIVTTTNSRVTYVDLAHLYVLGEKILDKEFKDAVIHATIDRKMQGGNHPSASTIKILYEGTPANSPARRLMIDFWVFAATPSWNTVKDPSELMSTDFLIELLPMLFKHRMRPAESPPWVASPESYYTDGFDDVTDSNSDSQSEVAT
ncbi:hypothetical protein P153DRAFT_315864 [Dothidotthia symphoricarpi CBS 119687]|uniref:BTB domain-containing protein n=1 Tax=Dothidotthia symphoricarpi CBS 119687 TaxID=1392245 RepID=A0A6A6AGW1_9PLEO|nr:uncharacterized protein P153DRAFT_315864 [Dothidotthia symphoricarpi CBS 119687]KAF2130154.1 hypothetical protein P153DRAFT_315864 [Dothidotthia symphoricarpi CBS 119687]